MLALRREMLNYQAGAWLKQNITMQIDNRDSGY